jgi:glycosyltransferase involved in cell wall biosynthesis
LRILHVTDRLSGRGGADWHLLGVIAQQLHSHHEVEMAVAYVDGTVDEPCPVNVTDGLGARTRTTTDLEPLVARLRPDVVHIHNVVNPTVLEWAADRGAVMTVQDHRVFCPGRGKLTADDQVCGERFSRETCARCFSDDVYFNEMLALTEERLAAVCRMRLTVLSHYMKDELTAAGAAEANVTVIPPFVHGLDTSAEPDGPACVLFVGRVVTAKGVHDAVSAWRRSGVELPLVVAGTGAERQAVEVAGAELLGWLAHEELARLYRRARAVMVPSRWQEPFGISGLEALTFGVPVVAYDSGGVRDWHPGPGLVPWGDVDALAAALAAAVKTRAVPPSGFEPTPLMARLDQVYASD